MTYLIGGLAFIFILGAAVVIHEFGHFIVAKLLKIRVETFSVGFGPRLFGKRWGHTDYRVSAIPLGGYVKLGGDESNAAIEGAGESDIPPEEQFSLRPRYQRIMVAVAGPVMNILTALMIPFVGAMTSGVPVMPAPIISHVKAGGAAETAGIQPGDRIVAFDGAENPTWERISDDAMLSPDHEIPIIVERNGQHIPLKVKPTKITSEGHELGQLDMEPDYGALPVIVGSVNENSPAAETGLKPGDRVVAIDGEVIHNVNEVTEYVTLHRDQPIHFKVERGGQTLELTTPERRLADGKLGFGFSKGPQEAVGPVVAIKYAVNSNIEILRLTGKALGQAFTGQRSLRDTLSGPIGIASESSKAANEYGWEGVFFMLSFMSLNLGIFNLLPIPVLDGGAIFILLLEAALGMAGLALSMTVRERIQQIGFVVLLLLMVFVITNDIIKQASVHFGSKNDQPAANAPQK
ncbi:MAG: RIP metalloprotease RseP [Acidobacteria bacterium 13_1_20CM_3_53_8]|nr:MAG: RIP metalloprotease RseP [Acidobacteria bacterium 13_1_20CM_3_53_8]